MITSDRYQAAIYVGLWSSWTVSIIAGADAEVVPNLEFTLTVSQDEFTLTADPELTTMEN